MNRVLSWPHTPVFPGLLKALMTGRHRTAVTDKGTIRFELERGPVEMKFSAGQQALPPGTPVYVWWKGGGFVCASLNEVHAEQRHAERVAERVMQARAKLEAARQERAERLGLPSDFASLPMPLQAPEQHPLLQSARS